VLRRRSVPLRFGYLATLVFATVAAAPTPPPEARVPEGRWGGVGLAVDVTAAGASIELDCAHGTIDAPLALDAEGNFDLPGTLVLERPGPVRQGEPERTEAIRVTGRLEGQTLTLRVHRPNTTDAPAPIEAALGKPPRLRKCD
jgi:hypothetical protein